MKTEVNPFLANGQENAFPPLCDIEWCIGRCPGLCTILLNNFTWYLKFMLYHAVVLIVGVLWILFNFYAQTVLWGPKEFIKALL